MQIKVEVRRSRERPTPESRGELIYATEPDGTDEELSSVTLAYALPGLEIREWYRLSDLERFVAQECAVDEGAATPSIEICVPPFREDLDGVEFSVAASPYKSSRNMMAAIIGLIAQVANGTEEIWINVQ